MWKKSFMLSVACSLFSVVVEASGLHTATADLPKTGQATTYSANDDGGLQWGAAWPDPRFTNPDGTAPVQGGVIVDRLTGLMWTKDGNAPGPAECSPATTKTWQGALVYVACLNKNTHLGYNDWRLPNRKELKSLVHEGQPDTAAWLHERGFLNVQASYYWSSTTYAGNANSAWVVRMSRCRAGYEFKAINYAVWPVRAGQGEYAAAASPVQTGQATAYAAGDDGSLQKGAAWPALRFTNADGVTPISGSVVVDKLTGLMWTRDGNAPGPSACLPGGLKTWQGALDYVACLNANTYLGYRDWRLPNVNELESLVNLGRPDTAAWLNTQGFINARAGYYWSSTMYAANTRLAWVTTLSNGLMNVGRRTLNYSVWPVRAGQAGSLVRLTISRSGTGGGSAFANPGPIIWSGSTGTAAYALNTAVTLTAVADGGAAFDGWSGACTGAGACVVTMDAEKGITATFIDTTPPSAPAVDGTSPTDKRKPAWTWTPGGGGNGTYRLQLDSESESWTTTTDLSYRPTSALAEGSHTLYVQERDAQGNWSASGSKMIKINGALTAPARPTRLDWSLDSGVSLAWTDNADNESGYRVYRRKSIDTDWTKIGETGPSSTRYADSTATINGTYLYYISAYNGVGEAKSGTVRVTSRMLSPPGRLTAANAGAGVDLTWRDESLGESGCDVWRRKNGESNWTKVASLGANAVSFRDTSAAAGTLHLYQVCATSADGGNACSTTATTNGPSALTAVYNSGYGVSLTWADNSSDESGFRIYRKRNAETTFTAIAATGANVREYVDGTKTSGIHFYMVCAHNAVVNVCSEVQQIIIP